MKNQNSEGQALSTKGKNVFEADVKLSHFEWTGKKIGGEHTGNISLSKGEVFIENGKLSGAFEIDMTSIVNTDLAGEWKEKLEGHLKSEDFFGVEKFPTAKFEITEAIPVENTEGLHLVKGSLTIKGKTHQIEFTANLKVEKGKISAAGEVSVDRSKYDVRYGSKSFFANIGDKMIHDEFNLKFNIVAIK